MVWHFALYTQTECTVDCGSARAILPLMSLCILSLLWACFRLFLSLSSFHVSARFLRFWQRERRAVWLTAARSGQDAGSWAGFGSFLVFDEVWFRPHLCANFCFLSVSLHWVLRFVFFFSFFPLFSLDSSSFWCGCSVIDCIFDFSGLDIQQLIGFFGLLIVCVFGFLGFVLGMLAFGRLCVLGGGLLVQLGSGWVDRWFGGGSILG